MTHDDNEETVMILDATNTNAQTFYLTYHDPYGNAYTTNTITMAATAADTCAAVQAALRALPGNVLSDVVVDSTSTTYLGIVSGVAESTPTYADLCYIQFGSSTSGTQYLLEFGNGDQSTSKGFFPILPGTPLPAAVILYAADTNAAGTALLDTETPDFRLGELADCSNRGVCDQTTGQCACFSGFRGVACDVQEALV